MANAVTPTIYIDNRSAQNQGYSQDDSNYYVWYSTSFSSHQISIKFTSTRMSSDNSSIFSPSNSWEAIFGITAGAVVVTIVLVILSLIIKGKKPGKTLQTSSVMSG